MAKKLLLFSALIVVSFTTFAGGLLTNTNQHIAYLRYLARQSSTEIDAIYYNPAGTAFFKEGWSFSLNGQSAFQTRTITSTFAPFAGNIQNLGESTKKFKGDAAAPIIPSLYAAYKQGHWTFSGSFAIIGGGGKATFDAGLPSFEAPVSLLPTSLNAKFGTTVYDADSYMHGKQIIYGLQMGAAYQINDNWSVFGGIRMNYVNNSYYGYVRNISSNIGGGTDLVNVSKYMTEKSVAASTAADYFEGIGNMAEAEKLRAQSTELKKVADKTGDIGLDSKQSGWGVTPIIGAHFHNAKWDVAVKYEMRTKLNVENKTKYDTTGSEMFKNGVNTPHDLPSILTFGATYQFLPTLRGSVGYNHYFDKGAKMAGGKQKDIKQGTNEYLGGLEWDICDWAQISAGLQRTKYGVTQNFQSDMSFSLSSMSYGFGAGFMLADNVKFNVAYFWTNYEKGNKDAMVAEKVPISYEFNRTNKVFGVGLDFSF
ncbi:OmpP1/FadL family transporter [Bacteroides propionicifaciens]|uniref:OmpP1/FadL family transporter n=1 Tax=Bacteroides propionicifaciens TaxID=392838 RepID=UPI00037C6607|nr:hypothetical protein [Bacteroides propionicifaciens]